jgi:uncharacterized protein (DUF302 family)
MTPLTVTTSSADVESTVRSLLAELDRRGIPLFDTVDHGRNATNAGLSMPAEVVIVFGNPSVGTRLMQADPAVGIELPLRLLVWDADGVTNVGYRDPRELAATYRLDAEAAVLEGMATLLSSLAEAVA